MTIDYTAAQALYVKHKRRLALAKKVSPHSVLLAVDAFYQDFDNAGFPLPDSWANWDRAKRDAELAIWMGRQDARY